MFGLQLTGCSMTDGAIDLFFNDGSYLRLSKPALVPDGIGFETKLIMSLAMHTRQLQRDLEALRHDFDAFKRAHTGDSK
jgi:hypothetical protein